MCNWGKVGQIAVVRRVAVRAGQMDTIPSKGCRERERERERDHATKKILFRIFSFREKIRYTRIIFISIKNTNPNARRIRRTALSLPTLSPLILYIYIYFLSLSGVENR